MSLHAMSALSLDLHQTPFSRAGSYLAISLLPTTLSLSAGDLTAGLYLRTVHGDATRSAICRIELLRGTQIAEASFSATPSLLTLTSETAQLKFLFSDAKTLHCSGVDAGLLLMFTAGTYDHFVCVDGQWQINSFTHRMRYALHVVAGTVSIESATNKSNIFLRIVPDAKGSLDLRLTEFEVNGLRPTPAIPKSFAIEQRECAQAFQAWLATLPTVQPIYAESRELAAYVTWSAWVDAQGHLRRPAMLMSKNWLHSVWSWDHCFNAMMLLNSHPALAWDQFMLPFDVQEQGGALPDCLNDKLIVWNFCKPPLHGWALAWMLRHSTAIGSAQLLEIYEPLARWTQWWQTARCATDGPLKGLPYYLHGNDSGWDNCVLFDAGMPMHTPELAALLVVQLQTLADIAARLQREDERTRWQHQSDELLDRLLAAFWRDDHFVARSIGDGCEHHSATLLLCMPLLLGKKLLGRKLLGKKLHGEKLRGQKLIGNKMPTEIVHQLITTLKNQFLTEHGLASQSPASPEYESDGYWRGPIWAPVVLILVESLHELGECELANKISHRFCTTVVRSGMAENFDALSGTGLRDPAHTWTASVFLLLAHDLPSPSPRDWP